MIPLLVAFWILVVFFGAIGSMRGWAREIMVTFSAIVGIFLIVVLENYVPAVRDTLVPGGGKPLFWERASIMVFLIFFGYQTPNLKGWGAPRVRREKLQESLLGFFMGCVNGFIIFGSLWYYMWESAYPFEQITPPDIATQIGQAASRLLEAFPPAWLTVPWIFYAVGLSFLFVIVVFI